jgi:UDP-glucose 4-epimerase
VSAELRGQRVLLTGATGFVGRHVLRRLLDEGALVTALTRTVPIDDGGIRSLECDLADPDSLRSHRAALRDIEAVIHLGAWIPPAGSVVRDESLRTFQVNAMGTVALLEQLPSKLSALCLTSTMDVYGRPLTCSIGEDHPTNPLTFYAASKLSMEHLTRVWGSRAGVPVSILRLSHVYGPGDTSSKVIPTFARAILRGEPPRVVGQGEDVRDYVFVDDVAAAIVDAVKRRLDATVNLGGGVGLSIREVADLLLEAMDCNLEPLMIERATSPTKIVANITRAQEMFGFVPATPIQQGLRETIAWLRQRVPVA